MDTLVERISSGMSTERDARVVDRAMSRLAAYELALRRIAVHGSGRQAALAARVLVDERAAYHPDDEALDAWRYVD